MKLVSWNIQWARGCDGRVSTQRIADTIRARGDPDLICLQEVAIGYRDLPGMYGEDQVAQFAALFPSHLPVFAPASEQWDRQGRRSCFGNLLLSRLPVRAAWRRLLPWPADDSVPSMQRSLAEVSVDSPGGPLRVLCTHLEYYSRRQRQAQIEALRALSAEVSDHRRHPAPVKDSNPAFQPPLRPGAALLCGDFNCTADSPEFRRLLAAAGDADANWVDLWSHLYPGTPHPHTVGLHGADWPDHPYCCDFALATPALLPRIRAVEVDMQTDASDHQPLWVTLVG
ncbi:endonuclease/exonuclease/phosphatase family protein [Methyloversatilis thermotolerans]|uniref:endonuclease/exonuclease/phosphatase family protein n=1 Tax=Methyloversatilis thermotolerans TaxID=1346290 RepID=UPI00036F935C|nr:endonuclease/exonuclease/phosphatase family protein [Methyloversatilis thermotolerans]